MSARFDDGPRFEATGDEILILARLIKPSLKQLMAPGMRPLRDEERQLLAALDAAVRLEMYRDSPSSSSGTSPGDDSGTLEYVNTTTAATLLGCTPRWVRVLARAGTFRSRMVDGRWQVALEDVEQRRQEEAA